MFNRLVSQANNDSLALSQMIEEKEGDVTEINAAVSARVGLIVNPVDIRRTKVTYSRITTVPQKTFGRFFKKKKKRTLL
jgi:hypothetical protein